MRLNELIFIVSESFLPCLEMRLYAYRGHGVTHYTNKQIAIFMLYVIVNYYVGVKSLYKRKTMVLFTGFYVNPTPTWKIYLCVKL